MKKICTLSILASFCSLAFSQVIVSPTPRVIITPEMVATPVIYPVPVVPQRIIITPSMIAGHGFYPTPYPYIYPQPWPFNQGFRPNPYPNPYPPVPPRPPLPPKPKPQNNNIGYCLNNSCPINQHKHHNNIGSSSNSQPTGQSK